MPTVVTLYFQEVMTRKRSVHAQYRRSRPGSDDRELSVGVQGDGSVKRRRERFTVRVEALGVFGGGCGAGSTQEASAEPNILFPDLGDGHLGIYFIIML